MLAPALASHISGATVIACGETVNSDELVVGAAAVGGVRGWLLRSLRRAEGHLRALLTWRPGRKDAAEVLLLASALPLYYLVRGQAHERVPEAIRRGVEIISLEKSLGIFWEVELQSWVLSYEWALTLLNGFYLYGHLPVIGALAVWLYFWHRPQYLFMRNAFLLSGAIALVIYVNFPTAPPRLIPDYFGFGFVDTVVEQYKTGRPLTPSFFVNEYAAMPSMHFGWNLLVGLAMWMASRNVLVRAFAVLMPLAMFADIVLTANHYILDAVFALPVVVAGILLAVGGRWLVQRTVSPASRRERAKGWVSWLYWLCGVAESKHHPKIAPQAA
jgi:hypothetical protein